MPKLMQTAKSLGLLQISKQ